MKGITFVQAFQYWMKAFAISLPLFVLMAFHGSYQSCFQAGAAGVFQAPQFLGYTEIKIPGKEKAPANVLAFSALGPSRIYFRSPTGVSATWGTVRKPKPGEDNLLPGAAYVTKGPSVVTAAPLPVTKGGFPVEDNGRLALTALKMEFQSPTTAVFTGGSYVPNAPSNSAWVKPFGTLTSKYGYPLLYTYSLIIALICGTAGLPHILVRFYTNPDGRAAKRTAFWVMILLGSFYIFTPIWGTLGRVLVPELYATSHTDAVVIALPAFLQHKIVAEILTGITSAGAFAAFMSTFSGLLVSMSGALAHDIYGKILNPNATTKQRLAAFKIAAVVFGALSILLGLCVESFDITLMVGWAFAIAAASYFPLLLLGCWWRGLTWPGAATGMLVGGILSLLAIVTYMGHDKKWLPIDGPPILWALLEQPAIWGVPLSILLMVVVSLATSRHVPPDIGMKMLRLHAPEQLGLSRNYVDEGRAEAVAGEA
jgi:Na+(H+)/acetate symporter ActP